MNKIYHVDIVLVHSTELKLLQCGAETLTDVINYAKPGTWTVVKTLRAC